MLSFAIRAWNIAQRTAVVYFVVLVGMRLAGKREMGQMTIFDLVLLLLIANAVQNAMVGLDTSLAGGLLAALVLLVNALVARLRLRWPRLRLAIEGSPILLVLHGAVLKQHKDLRQPSHYYAAGKFIRLFNQNKARSCPLTCRSAMEFIQPPASFSITNV